MDTGSHSNCNIPHVITRSPIIYSLIINISHTPMGTGSHSDGNCRHVIAALIFTSKRVSLMIMVAHLPKQEPEARIFQIQK